MVDLSAFPITKRWPASNPGAIQLYSSPTPNGVKISIALEELGLPYEAHRVELMKDDQKTPEFLALNPNGKIPAMIDPDGPGGKPFGLFETGAMLVYLAEKTGKLMPVDAAGRYKTLQWVIFQVANVGPMFGQFGHFYKSAADKLSDPYPEKRYRNETKRLLDILEQRLADREWLMGDDYTIADIATFPWVRVLGGFYEAGEILELDGFSKTMAWVRRCEGRPASKTGLEIPRKT